MANQRDSRQLDVFKWLIAIIFYVGAAAFVVGGLSDARSQNGPDYYIVFLGTVVPAWFMIWLAEKIHPEL
jgi:preprotein translocase subunit SecY